MKGKRKLKDKELILILEKRFKENMNRHIDVKWNSILERLNGEVLLSLKYMEETGGEPDIVIYDKEPQVFLYCDCSKESPIYRRNLCYDNEAGAESYYSNRGFRGALRI